MMENYKIRMIQEYKELKEQLMKLRRILILNDVGKLDFVPTCPTYILEQQKNAMEMYLHCLEDRAILEDVDLEADIKISWERELSPTVYASPCSAEEAINKERKRKVVFRGDGTVIMTEDNDEPF